MVGAGESLLYLISLKFKGRETTMVKVVCPRCGGLGYAEAYNIGGKRYLYVVHGHGKNRTKCYIGPVDGYDHAELLLALGLTNIHDIDYLIVIENALIRFINEMSLKRMKDEGGRTEALEKLKAAEKKLQVYLEEITKLRKDIEKEIEALEKQEAEISV